MRSMKIFDLKGSSLNRFAKVTKRKKDSKNVPILKDTNLGDRTFRVGDISSDIVEQLEKDADFLCGQGIMDYSLLVGIHNCSEKRELSHLCNDAPSSSSSSMPSTKQKSFTTVISPPPISPSPSVSLTLPPPSSSHKASNGNEDEKDEKALKIVISDETNKNLSDIPASTTAGPGICKYHMGIIDCLQQWNWAKRLEQATKIVVKCHCYDYKLMSAVEPISYATRFKEMAQRLFVK